MPFSSAAGRTPWVTRSWLALAGAADHRYTMEMLPALLQSKTPKLLVWGEGDGFQTVDYAERYERQNPPKRGSSGSSRLATFRWRIILTR